MKNIRKILGTILAASSMSFLLTGCGAEKMTPEESGKAYYELAAKQDVSIVKEIMGEEMPEFTEMLEAQKEDAKDTAVSMFSSYGFDISDETMKEYLDSYFNALKKSDCTNVSILNETEDEVQLKIDVTSIDIIEIYKEIGMELQNKYKEMIQNGEYVLTDYKTLQSDMVSDMIDMLIVKLDSSEADSTNSFTYFFEKKTLGTGFLSSKELWIPEGTVEFGMQSSMSAFNLSSMTEITDNIQDNTEESVNQ